MVFTVSCDTTDMKKNLITYYINPNRQSLMCGDTWFVYDEYKMIVISVVSDHVLFSIDVNECLDPVSCVHGTCTNGYGSFVCRCHQGWSGRNCDIG